MAEDQVKCAEDKCDTEAVSESGYSFPQALQNTGSGEAMYTNSQQPEHQGSSDIDLEVITASHSDRHEGADKY